jgi:menaquinone reductase, molybdopterin-binding-like subunit
MKLSRRCFLSFVVGGAAGTALSPLPWKLVDDSSIWSQNWPWTPVPSDGQGSYTRSTCSLCPGGCGISVRKIDERAIKIEGTQGHPLNDGGICMLGLSGLQLLYGPTRIPAPLKRVGERGQGQWQTLTWPEAIKEVAAKLGDIRSQGSPQSVAAIASKDAGTVPQLLSRLMSAFGSPNFFRMPGVEDAYEAAVYLTQGTLGSAGLDIENADFVLSFGSALLDGYGSPVRMFRAKSKLKDRHGMVVQIEPRLSNTAAKADTWMAINPGSEVDLALAMAHVIITQKAVNQQFISDFTEGYDAFAQMVQEKYAPEAVAGKIGIDADTIKTTALAFAAAKKPLAIFGRGKGQTPGSLKEALAVHALNALVGNINAPGGVQALPAYDYINWPDNETDAVAAAGLQTQRIDGAGTDQYPHVRYLLNRMAQGADKIQALLVAEANPRYSMADSTAVNAALDSIPFVVSFSSFMDETAMNADLILPNHTYLERYEDVPVTAGVSRPTVGLCRPVVEPLLDTQHLGDTLLQIAKALGGSVAASFPWKDYASCLKQTLLKQWNTLDQQGVWVADGAMPRFEGGFETASGKFMLMNDDLGAIYLADDAVMEGTDGGYDLVLVPYDSIRLASRYVGDAPFMMKTVSDKVLKGQESFVEINPQTARKLGLTEGRLATLTTPKGQAKVRVSLYEGIRPGVVAMPRGLGHATDDPFLAGKGVNVNQLIGPVEDPASGLDAAWGIGAKLA